MNSKDLHLLKRYIHEAVQVTVVKLDQSGSPLPGAVNQVLNIDDDDQDELRHFLDRYAYRPQPGLLKKNKRKKVDDGEQDKTRKATLGIIDKIMLMTPGQSNFTRDSLLKVASQWGTEGIDALSKISISQGRTGKPFPFFGVSGLPMGDTIKYPEDPTKRVVQDILNMSKPNLGRGEILLSFMTGADRASNNSGGDLSVNGDLWQVKDIRSDSSARLGDAATEPFLETLKVRTMNLSPQAKKIINGALSKVTTHIPPNLLTIVNDALRDSLETKRIVGFVLLTDAGFQFIPPSDVVFERLASGRISVGFPSVTGKNPRVRS